MERVIVTGANGFIGRNFIRYLSEKEIEVYAVDISHDDTTLIGLKNVFLIECPLSEISTLKVPPQKYDVFYHFAWAGVNPGKDRFNYIKQSENAIYTCHAAIVSKELECNKFIVTGTIIEKSVEHSLKHNLCPNNLMYGISKKYAHDLLKCICNNTGINYIWAQLPNIMGGNNVNGNLISYTLQEFNEGRIPMYGPCTQYYNFTYIDDILDGLFLLGSVRTNSNEYLISNGECMQLKEYIELIGHAFNKEVGLGFREDDGVKFRKEWFNNILITELGFVPKFTFNDMIQNMRRNK